VTNHEQLKVKKMVERKAEVSGAGTAPKGQDGPQYASHPAQVSGLQKKWGKQNGKKTPVRKGRVAILQAKKIPSMRGYKEGVGTGGKKARPCAGKEGPKTAKVKGS